MTKILLVDDEPELRNLIADGFQGRGYEVLTAGSAPEALKLLSASSGIECMVSDIRMPGMNGIDLLKEAKSLYPKLKVILISGFADLSPAQAQELGATGLLEKPFPIKQLIEMVSKIRGA